MNRLALFVVPALILAGCASGPDYKPPAIAPAATGPLQTAAQPPFTAAQPPSDWWRLFRSPALDELVAQALAANKDIAVAQANLAQVRAVLSETRTQLLPSTQVSASATRARQPNPLTGQGFTASSFSAGIDVSYEVDVFGRVRRSIEASRADTDAAEAALQAAQISVAAETARAYADGCSAAAQLAVAHRTVDLQTETFQLVTRQLDAGRGSALDEANAGAQLQSTTATIAPLEAQRDAALYRLTLLLGRTPAEAPAAARQCDVAPRVEGVLPVGDGAALLRRRPDVRQAERQLAAATARIGVATASLYPSVTLGGGVAAIGSSGVQPDYTFNVGPLISWSFPNIAAGRSRVRQAGAVADAALARFDGTVLTALQETETALSQYSRELDRAAVLEKAVAQATEAVRLGRIRYTAGIDSFLTVLDAERTLASLETQLAQSRALIATDQIVVFKALGGGWTTASAAP